MPFLAAAAPVIGAIGGGVSAVKGIADLAGGSTGAKNFASDKIDIKSPVDPNQVAMSNVKTNNALSNQQAFLNALAGQNGIGNQSDVYNQQQAFLDQLVGQNGVANQNNVFAQQQALANQLQGVADGTGPNPAAAALAQATGNNVANQAALMASQRGSGANVGLLARQAALAGGNIQQQAAGQGATMQAQQQLNAMQALQGQQQLLGNTASNQIGNQAAQQQALANLATQQVNQQATVGQQATQNAQAQQKALMDALQRTEELKVNQQNNVNSVGGSVAQANINQDAKDRASALSGIAAGLGGLAGMAGTLGDLNEKTLASSSNNSGGGPSLGVNTTLPSVKFAHGGEVKSSHAIQHLRSMKSGVQSYAVGGAVTTEGLASKGMPVPGKAKVAGDDLKNDTVNAKLSPGEVVIPRSIMNSANPAAEAAKFVAAIVAKKKAESAKNGKK